MSQIFFYVSCALTVHLLIILSVHPFDSNFRVCVCFIHSNEEVPANPDSPVSAKRRVLSQSALRSHRPVARPVSVGLPR